MSKETSPSKGEQYLNTYIVGRMLATAELAKNCPTPDAGIVFDAVYFDKLVHEPEPEYSHDNDYPDGETHHGD